ncbi:MAG: phosphoglycerate mutase, partial [Burkholderiaceae bacterium]
AMRPFFEEDGMALSYAAPTRWLARGELFRDLATASLDRVLGRPIDAWMPEAAQAKPLRRLQNEMQMLLYTHPVNDARAQRGLPPVNSFWVSGTGALPPPSARGTGGHSASPVVPHTLREAALRENWPAWAQAWQQLDATEVARLLAALDQQGAARLTLCGERSACTYEARPQSLWRRISSSWGGKPLSFILQQL